MKDSRSSSKKRTYAKGKQGGLRDDYVPAAPRGFVGTRGDAKYKDTAAATYQADQTGSITHLSAVGQGTSVNTREGKAFRCTSVNVRGTINSKATTTSAAYCGYLVWDYSPQKAIAAITDIFDSATFVSFPKRENNERFKVIKKYLGVVIGASGTPTTGCESYEIDDYVKLPKDANVLCTTGDTTGAIGNTIQGALYWVTFGQVPAGTGAAEFVVQFRVNFTDKTK